MGEVRRRESHASPDFDRIARLYRWLEYLTVGPLLARTRNHFLPRLAECRSALVLGDGDGRFTARMMAMHGEMRVQAIDLSPIMMELLKARVARVGARDRLRTTVGDALKFEQSGRLDLIVTHFFLDCLTQDEMESLVRRLRPHLAKGALWLASDFRVPRKGWLRVPGWLLIRGLYAAFRLLTGLRVTRVPSYGRMLAEAGLVRVEMHEEMGGLLVTELSQVMVRDTRA